ncbi:MAG: hypothetical protein K2L45_01255 [Muribaculaceae bacterium]|nr:hypothetical protein [Muribaculaceae bacterium]
MQIGFVNFNTEERKRVAKMMQLLQESEAIEELGIGRVRDHFSNTLFPGTSTLQHHAKYFVVLPALYYYTAFKNRKFQNIAEVSRFIKEAEIQITRQMAEWDNGKIKTKQTGITGINTLNDALHDYTKYVKYDPAYIYGSGLTRYGIIPDTGVERLILELNKKYFEDPHNNRTLKREDSTDDAGDLTGEKQLIKTCGENYDFFNGKTMELSLTEKEASFLKDRIHATCDGTLLDYLINSRFDIPENIGYFDMERILSDLSFAVVDIYKKSVLFSKLMHLVDWRFNYCYYNSFGKYDDAEFCENKYIELLREYEMDIKNQKAYNALFDYIRNIDTMLSDFCENCYKAIINVELTRIDQLVKAREYTVKRDRSKIGNPVYKDQRRGNPFPNTFRWETVRTIANEIRNPHKKYD